MKKKRFTEEQIAYALAQASTGQEVADRLHTRGVRARGVELAVRLLGHGEVGSVCLHPSISAAEIKVLRFLAERMRILVSTLLDVYAFVSARLGNTEPETESPASPSDARRDKPPRSPRRSASAPNAPRPWPTPRDLCARNPLPQNAVRTPQTANAPAVWPGHSL